MYLSMLSTEKKYLFRDLELIMSNVDGDFSPEEKNIIDAHCIEMHIDNNNYEIDTRQDEVLNQLQESLTEQERSIFFLELVGTVMADDVYHDSEKELIGKLAQILQVSEAKVNEAFTIITEMKSVYAKCAAYIK